MPLIKYTADEDGITTITLNRDAKRNAINNRLAEQILQRLDAAEDDGTRVLILRANPGAPTWCAGHDLSDLDVRDLHVENLTLEVARKIQSVPFPVIALVEGSVYGGGVILLLYADLVVATPSVALAITSNKLGVPLSPDLHAFWLRVIGLHKAKELLFTAGAISAADACQAGLINRVVGPSELESCAMEWAQRIKMGSPAAIASTKRQLNAIAGQTGLSATQVEEMGRQDDEILQSQDTRARIASLLAALRRSKQ